jgi:ABC-type multidrug transport system ATPase subunit
VSAPGTAELPPLDFAFVAVDDVSRVFGRRRALSRVSLRVETRQIAGIQVPYGAGKSTLLGILATLLRPTTGRVRYGEATAAHGATLRARIGVLGHDLFLYPELTARENLEFFAGAHGLRNPRVAAEQALAQAGLDDRADDPVSTFSRGMRQRVALERALIHQPRLLLLDEPFTGLDDASAAALLRRLRALRDSGAMVDVATHDLDLADGLLDQALFLRDGRPAASVPRPERLRSTYQDVMARPANGAGA